MSRLQSGNNSYPNGTYRQPNEGSYGGSYRGSYHDRSSTRGRERRAGGYGGFYANSGLSELGDVHSQDRIPSENVNTSHAPTFSDRQAPEWHSESRKKERDAVQNGASVYGSGPAGRQIESVIDHITEKWEVMLGEDCVPVQLSLQLMDHSSLGRGSDYQDFQRTSKRLQNALRSIVNEHHQGFNSSIGTFHKIQSSIQASQGRVRTLRDSILSAKSNLMLMNPELQDLGMSSHKYEINLQTLGQIQKLQVVPEQLDALIADKHFLSAVGILQDSLQVLRQPELEQLGALSDLRIYFSNQEISLIDTLIEELHDHIYLKSPYCHNRWKPYVYKPVDLSQEETSMPPSMWDKPFYRFLESLKSAAPFCDEHLQNPETDSFQYIHLLLEAMNKLGCLVVAIERTDQRLPRELFTVVERTNQEVEMRHSPHIQGQSTAESRTVHFSENDNHGRNNVLSDLLWTLYAKLEAIAEGHRAVHDIVARIASQQGLRHRNSLTRGFNEMWKLYQSEIRSLLHDYLATDGNTILRLGKSGPGNPVSLNSSSRDKGKRVFDLRRIDSKSGDIPTEQDELNKILQASVPGLVSKPQRRSDAIYSDDNPPKGGSSAGHKLLVVPSVFNIGILLPPSLSFLQRLKDIVPPDSDIAISTLTSFLDDFLVNVFHPQFEETVVDLCRQSYTDRDAFEEDFQKFQRSNKPLFKGTLQLFMAIQAFCRLLKILPQDQMFTELLVTQITTYLDQCHYWFKALVERRSTQDTDRAGRQIPTAIIENGDFKNIIHRLWEDNLLSQDDLIQTEIEQLVLNYRESPLETIDVIWDRRLVISLCLLYTSMQWLADQLIKLRYIIPSSQATQRGSARPEQIRRWTELSFSKSPLGDGSLQLPMSEDLASRFDECVSSMRTLALDAIFTLHVNIRFGVIHTITRMLGAPYILHHPTNNPDPSVLSLSADLLDFDEDLASHVSIPEHRFVTRGLAALIDTFLVMNASQIKSIDEFGCGRMQINILVLQQNLKAVEGDVSLSRSAQFFDLFTEGADAIVAKAKADRGRDLNFSLEEMKTLVELCYSQGLQSPQREAVVQAKRGLSEHLLELSE